MRSGGVWEGEDGSSLGHGEWETRRRGDRVLPCLSLLMGNRGVGTDVAYNIREREVNIIIININLTQISQKVIRYVFGTYSKSPLQKQLLTVLSVSYILRGPQNYTLTSDF